MKISIVRWSSFKSKFEMSLFLNDVNHCSLTKWEKQGRRNCCDDNYVYVKKKIMYSKKQLYDV